MHADAFIVNGGGCDSGRDVVLNLFLSGGETYDVTSSVNAHVTTRGIVWSYFGRYLAQRGKPRGSGD